MSPYRSPGHARTSPDARDPRLRGRTLAVPFAVVWDAALALARARRGWTVTDVDPRAGEIAAEAVTRLWRFTDDVRIRIALDGAGMTRVDMESSSRIRGHDLGTNARRIARFLHDLDARLAGRR